MRTKYREEDPEWFDPKVPDGESLTGPLGLDSKNNKDLTKKADTPGDLDEFQTKVLSSLISHLSIIDIFIHGVSLTRIVG